LRNIKNKKIFRKKASESAHLMIYFLQVMMSYQENNNQTAC